VGDLEGVTATAQDVSKGYAPHDHRPLAGYGTLTAGFGAALGGTLLALRASGRELPERPAAADLVLAGIATHKLSRLLAKDRVTSFLRAPFTRYQDRAGHGEIEEAARGRGLQKAIGELLICPYCLSQWVAAGFAGGFVAAPRLTRFLAGMWTIEAISDGLQLAYGAAGERS
jgi:hypothetical protein